MADVLIHRLETMSGGVYDSGTNAAAAACTNNSQSTERTPMAHDDKGMMRKWGSIPFNQRGDYLFGFPSLPQLLDWFPMPHLLAKHVVCNIYSVPSDHVICGDKQCVFIMDVAHIVDTIKPSALKSSNRRNVCFNSISTLFNTVRGLYTSK